MLRKLLLTVAVCLFSIGTAFAQSGTLTGTVTDASSGEVLPGVNIFIPDLERGAPTNAKGEFTIEDIEYGTYTIRATFVGYKTFKQEVTIDQGNVTLDIELAAEQVAMDDVVVTAFGLTREERSLSSSVQEVSGEDLTMASETNLVSSLSGKVSGVQVVGSPGAALGGSQKIRIRGESGLSESNPLFVVDGTPISNQSFTFDDRDYGNLAQDLNLDDIQSISVLKGASASALYGNRAKDGVIVIKTKGGELGEKPIQIDFSNTTSLSSVYNLPGYQNKYAGGYSGEIVQHTDPETGETVAGLEYGADESWGPRMEGQMYRPWWSWYHADFTGDGQDDYGTEVPLEPNPDNVKNFYETGIKYSNSLAISGGSENSSYRVSVEDLNEQGVMPNSKLDRTYLNFKGSLAHGDKFVSRVAFNYVNNQLKGRPSQTYSPLQGNPTQMFNQWFQRQLSMDKLSNYALEDGTYATWNIISPSNTTPQYWNSPYFTTQENVPFDDRNRVYGNYTLNYNITENLQATGRIHADVFDFSVEDRVATGGLNQDWYKVMQITRREMNYEGSLQYQEDFGNLSFDGFIGASLRQERYKEISDETQGGLSVPDLYTIEASTDRPEVSNVQRQRDVRSLYGTFNAGWKDMLYAEVSLRNDWSSALPSDNNSYLYYGFSGSFVFTELGAFENTNWLTFGKLRASIAQVGSDLDPYQVTQNFSIQSPRGSYAAMRIPETRYNPDLKAAISTDYEFGLDLRFLNGRLRFDGTYYNSVSQDEILELNVSSTSGFNQMLVNAGDFVQRGLEFQFEGTPLQQNDWTVDLSLNWATQLENKIKVLDESINSRLLDGASFGPELYAREGETWGKIVSNGYQRIDGKPVFNPETGGYFTETNVDQGTILPDWNGGFRVDVSYKNWSLGGFIEFQKGGQFYSVSKAFNNYTGLGDATTGTNVLGNPLRDPVLDQNGEEQTAVLRDQVHEESGGILVKGVNQDGEPVEYITNTRSFYVSEFTNKEAYIYDASYVKLKSLRLSYNLSAAFLEQLPLRQASIAIHAQNPLLIYTSADDLDPSVIQEAGTEFGGWWEGGSVPGTRSVGFTVNLGF